MLLELSGEWQQDANMLGRHLDFPGQPAGSKISASDEVERRYNGGGRSSSWHEFGNFGWVCKIVRAGNSKINVRSESSFTELTGTRKLDVAIYYRSLDQCGAALFPLHLTSFVDSHTLRSATKEKSQPTKQAILLPTHSYAVCQ